MIDGTPDRARTRPDSEAFRGEAGPDRPPLVLASRSPRRRELLHSAGIAHEVVDAGIDDGDLRPGRQAAPESWVAALGYLKARAGAEAWAASRGDASAVVLGADTVCVAGGELLGQPSDGDDAERMLRALSGVTHRVLTGVALVESRTGQRCVFVDAARVTLGPLDEGVVTSYLESGAWSGKAGAYNLSDRLDAGWPITYEGDPSTIMGLPMRRLTDELGALLG